MCFCKVIYHRFLPAILFLLLSQLTAYGHEMRPAIADIIVSPAQVSVTIRFNAELFLADIDASEIHCLQKKLNGEVIITFRSISSKEKLLRLSSLKVNSENLAVQDIDRPLPFLTIYNAPFKLSDLAII